MAEEVLDVLDDTGEVVDQATRREVHQGMLPHLAVHVLLQRPDGTVLLQKRSEGKRTFPGKWTSSASGHVPSGEQPAGAAVRECQEEIGLTPSKLSRVGETVYRDPGIGEHELVVVYTGQAAGEPDPAPEEVAETTSLAPAAIDRRIEAEPHVFALPFLPVWQLARDHLDDRPLD